MYCTVYNVIIDFLSQVRYQFWVLCKHRTIQHPYLYNLCSLKHLGFHTINCNVEEDQKGLGGPVP